MVKSIAVLGSVLSDFFVVNVLLNDMVKLKNAVIIILVRKMLLTLRLETNYRNTH